MPKLKANNNTAEQLPDSLLQTYRAGLDQYTTREEMHEGELHLIAPVVLMVEGVHNGSGGRVLYTREELSRFAAHWNGVPVPVLHPTTNDGNHVSANSPEIIEQYNVGRVFNARWDEAAGKLRGEVWVNIRKAMQVDPIVLATMRAGGALEVSTGLFSEDEPVGGTWNNEQYTTIARNIRADHLALLPGQIGACSIADGCGLRANEEGGDHMKKVTVTNKAGAEDVTVHRLIKRNAERGQLETARLLQSHLDSMDNALAIHYLDDVFANSIVYHVRPGDQATDQTVRYYRRGYSVNEAGEVTLGDDLSEVVRQTEFVAVNEETQDSDSTEEDSTTQNEEDQMARKELISSLRANNSVNWAETDEARLLALNCEDFAVELSTNMGIVFKANTDTAAAAADSDSDEPAPAAAAVVEDEPTANADQTMEQYIADAPAHLKDGLTSAVKANSAARTTAIATIKANKQNKFTDEQLSVFTDDQLQGMVTLAQTQGGGHFGGRVNADQSEIIGNDAGETAMVAPTPFAAK